MQAADGHFYYRDLGWKKVKTPMLHWGQGTMFKALAHLLSKMSWDIAGAGTDGAAGGVCDECWETGSADLRQINRASTTKGSYSLHEIP